MQIFNHFVGSCADLRKLFDRISPDMAVVQLGRGPLLARLQSFSLGAFRLTLLETNQTLFLAGTRRPELCAIAIQLKGNDNVEAIRAQGHILKWDGIFGYNLNLKDYDLKIPGNSLIASIIFDRKDLSGRLRNNANLGLSRFETTNQLRLKPETVEKLRTITDELIQTDGKSREPGSGDQILEIVFNEVMATNRETVPAAVRENRHQAAIELLHWCIKHPEEHKNANELSNLLFQSRTSLFKGCQEHFHQTLGELQRSIRLDLARQLLLNPEQRQKLGLAGVGDISRHLGFTSRSHFSKRYEHHYAELPVETLKRQTTTVL